MSRAVRRFSYRGALEWIALNDDTEFLADPDGHISVTLALVADMFGKSNQDAIRDLRRTAERIGADR